jgi:hypothetical protein
MKSFAVVIALTPIIASMAPAQEIGSGLPEKTTVLPKTAATVTGGNPWIERVVAIKAGDTLSMILRGLGATPEEVKAIGAVLGEAAFREGRKLRVLLSPVSGLQRLQPVRIMLVDDQNIEAIVALSDMGRYVNVGVLGLSTNVPQAEAENAGTKSDRLESADLIPEQPGDAIAALKQPAAGPMPEPPREVSVPASPTAGPQAPAEVSVIPFPEGIDIREFPREVRLCPPAVSAPQGTNEVAEATDYVWPTCPAELQPPSVQVPSVPLSRPDHAPALAPWPVRDAAPLDRSSLGPSERLAALPLAAKSGEPVRPKLNLPLLERPTWAWPPGRFWWALAPGLPSASWTWQAGRQPVLPEMIRIASRVELPAVLQAKLPAWVAGTSAAMMAAESVPPWPRVRRPDFRIPTGASRFAGERNLEPPLRFVRWFDRIETVLPIAEWREVDRRCRAILAKSPPPGKVIRGCARGAAGRCFVTRIDDPGVARHELAHCNGWRHPE